MFTRQAAEGERDEREGVGPLVGWLVGRLVSHWVAALATTHWPRSPHHYLNRRVHPRLCGKCCAHLAATSMIIMACTHGHVIAALVPMALVVHALLYKASTLHPVVLWK